MRSITPQKINNHYERFQQRSTILALLVIVLALLVLIGWTFGIKILSQPIPDTAAMNPFTAICFILQGVSLILLTGPGRTSHLKTIGIILAFLSLALTTLILGEIIFDTNIHVDTWLFYSKMDTGVKGHTLNFMAPNTAMSFMLTSMALLLLNKQISNKWIPSQFLAVFVGFISLMSLLGYLYNIQAFYVVLKYFPMALHTSIGFLFMTTAILFVNNDKGLMSEFSGAHFGSIMARKLLPAALIIPILLGFLRLFIVRKGIVSDELGVELLVMSNMVIFILLIWISARELNKKDISRKEAEEKLRENNVFLDTVFENIPNMLFIKEAKDLNFLRLNRAGEKLLGYREHDLIGKNDYDFFPKKQADFFLKKDREIIKKGVLENIKEEMISTVHGERWLHTKKIPVYDKNGKPLFIIGISEDVTQQKEAQENLRNTLKEVSDYKYALDESALVAVTDQKGIIKQVNDYFCKISKYSREELIGQDHRIINSGYHPKAFIKNLWTTIANGDVWHGELRNKAKDGTIYWVNTTIVPFLNEQGKPYQYVAIRADITERKLLENEIKQFNLELEQKIKERTDELATRENHLASIFNTVADILFVLEMNKDGHYYYTSINPTFTKITGLNHDVILGKKVDDILPKKTFSKALGKCEKAINTKSIARWEEVFYYPTGKLIGEVSIVPVYDETGACTKLIGSIHDLTDRKKAEEDLQKSENRFRDFFENAPESILVLDLASSKFIKTNKNASKLFKYSSKELTKKGPIDISPKFQPDGSPSEEKAKEYIEKAMQGKKVSFEWVHRDAERKLIPCEVHLALLPDTKHPQIYASIVDITERNEIREKLKQQYKALAFQNEEIEKRAEELDIANIELQKTNSELDRFVYSASHDLRSPLKSLLGLSDLIKEDIKSGNPVELEQIDMLKSSILKLDDFIEDILQYSRNARTKVAQEVIDCKEILQDITNRHKYMEEAKDIKIKIDMAQGIKFVSDKRRLSVVLNNLISNAIKYKDPSKSNPFVTVDVNCNKNHAIIRVEDNGIGIGEKDKEKIFEMFYRATKVSKGSGIGLYIVKEAIEKLDGTIHVESELGKGSTFTVTIPNQITKQN